MPFGHLPFPYGGCKIVRAITEPIIIIFVECDGPVLVVGWFNVILGMLLHLLLHLKMFVCFIQGLSYKVVRAITKPIIIIIVFIECDGLLSVCLIV